MREIAKSTTPRLTISHVNIRESISLLLFKLIWIDFIVAVISISLQLFFISETGQSISFLTVVVKAGIVSLLVVIQIVITIIVILNWLNEYYELTTTSIEYMRGIIFRTRENYSFTHIRSVKIDQGIIGKLFNYGTLTLFDWDLQENVILRNIHNPMKYLHLLEELLPNIDTEKHLIRDQFIEIDEE